MDVCVDFKIGENFLSSVYQVLIGIHQFQSYYINICFITLQEARQTYST